MSEAEIEHVRLTPDHLTFELKDGRVISVPLAFYPTLLRATTAEREEFELCSTSVHWPALDCDIGVEGMLAGARELPLYADRPRKSGGVTDYSPAILREETVPKKAP